MLAAARAFAGMRGSSLALSASHDLMNAIVHEDEQGSGGTTNRVAQGDESAPAPSSGERANDDDAATEGEEENDESDEDSGSDSCSDDDYDDDDENRPRRRRWRAIEEDTSLPCSDELAYIETQEEHSALDYEHWEKVTFFGLHDPEIVPGESGQIEWQIDKFNGTKADPNNTRILRSPIVKIGGLDWQIKFYPRGNRSEYLSAYIECVSMHADEYAEFEDFTEPPFPFLAGTEPVRRRRSTAVQLCLVMYNPAEPRVHEYQIEAHQFHKQSPDFGWKYYSQYPHYEFHTRQHKQRQAILRNDRLAFIAYIRVVHDPTGGLWEHRDRHRCDAPDQMTRITGLRPFAAATPALAAGLSLLHFPPFRDFVRKLNPDQPTASWLQHLLLKMYTRQRSRSYGAYRGLTPACDVMEMLSRFSSALRNELSGDETLLGRFKALVGPFHAETGTASGPHRLQTTKYPSLQTAIDHHPTPLDCPALLTLELERQTHDKATRKWKKLLHAVTVPDTLTVSGHAYTLFAFVTHVGHLQSSRYYAYVRPRGPGRGWYAYRDAAVVRLTEQQARNKHSGGSDVPRGDWEEGGGAAMPFEDFDPVPEEAACVVMYVREDFVGETFEAPREETWVPGFLKKGTAAAASAEEEAKGEEEKVGEKVEEKVEVPASMDVAAEVGVPPVSDDEGATVAGGEAPVVSSPSKDDTAAVPAPPTTTTTTTVVARAEELGSTPATPILNPALAASIAQTAGASTPEPERLLMDGEDVVMHDAPTTTETAEDDDDVSNYSFRLPDAAIDPPKPATPSDDDEDDAASSASEEEDDKDSDPPLDASSPLPTTTTTTDWLGRPYYSGPLHPTTHQYHGPAGHLISLTGDEYRGSFRSGRPHGHGTMIYSATGDVYTGAWRHGLHHGAGTLTAASTGNVCEGHWRKGRQWGPFVLRGQVADDQRAVCSVCYDAPLDTAFYDCGHVVACKGCAARVDVCPVCRRRVAARVTLFGVRVMAD